MTKQHTWMVVDHQQQTHISFECKGPKKDVAVLYLKHTIHVHQGLETHRVTKQLLYNIKH